MQRAVYATVMSVRLSVRPSGTRLHPGKTVSPTWKVSDGANRKWIEIQGLNVVGSAAELL
jgi:hypothetical protein